MEFNNFILKSLGQASDIARKRFGQVAGTIKDGDYNQVLTETDLEIGNLLTGNIQRTYPGFNIIDEEAGVINNNSNYTWVVDPVDGTSNFAHGSPLYGIMLGLMKDFTPVAGGIALPFFSDIYIAEKGQGAFCNSQRINVIKEKDLNNVLVGYGIDGHRENPGFTRKECSLLAEIILGIRNLRVSNSVFDTVMVARGSYGAFLNRTSKIWDNVAQQVIIEEAGGLYTDFFGQVTDYSGGLSGPLENFTFLAAAPSVHSQLLKIIREHSDPE